MNGRRASEQRAVLRGRRGDDDEEFEDLDEFNEDEEFEDEDLDEEDLDEDDNGNGRPRQSRHR